MPAGTGMLASWTRWWRMMSGNRWVCGPSGETPPDGGIGLLISTRASFETITRVGLAATIA